MTESRHPLSPNIETLNDVRQRLPLAADDGFLGRLLFDRAIDVANIAVEWYLRSEGLALPATATARLSLAIGRLGASGARGLRETDLDDGIRQRNGSVHRGRPNTSTLAQATTAEAAARSLVVAIIRLAQR